MARFVWLFTVAVALILLVLQFNHGNEEVATATKFTPRNSRMASDSSSTIQVQEEITKKSLSTGKRNSYNMENPIELGLHLMEDIHEDESSIIEEFVDLDEGEEVAELTVSGNVLVEDSELGKSLHYFISDPNKVIGISSYLMDNELGRYEPHSTILFSEGDICIPVDDALDKIAQSGDDIPQNTSYSMGYDGVQVFYKFDLGDKFVNYPIVANEESGE